MLLYMTLSSSRPSRWCFVQTVRELSIATRQSPDNVIGRIDSFGKARNGPIDPRPILLNCWGSAIAQHTTFGGIGEMFRGLVAIVSAAALLWHAVVGCCAHHNHASIACSTNAGCATASDGSPEVRGCCHGRSHWSGSSDNSPAAAGGTTPSAPSPEHFPGHCTEGSCVIGAPSKPGPTVTDSLASIWSAAQFFSVDPTHEVLTARTLAVLAGNEPPPLGGLRSHLALSVLTL